LKSPYFVIVHTVARNLGHPLTFPIEVKTEKRKTREFELGDLISELEEAHIKINEIEQQIAQHYSIDIPISQQGQAVVFDFSNPKAGMEDRFKY
jgi:methyltransferase-like protein